MTYALSWAWVGGRVPQTALMTIQNWASKGIEGDVQPVLWVDNVAFYSLQTIQAAAVAIGGGLSTRTVMKLGGRNVAVVNINAPSGEGWNDPGGVFAHFRVPGWGNLRAAVTAEATNNEGLKQVASDIVRVAAVWLVGGAYFDIDSQPAKTKLGEKAVTKVLASSKLAVVPLVMYDTAKDWYRVENGVIVTNPNKAAAAKELYKAILTAMATMFTQGTSRIQTANQIGAEWVTQSVTNLNELISTYEGKITDANRAKMENRLAVLRYLRDNLPGKTTLIEIDQVLANAVSQRTQTDGRVSRLIYAMITQKEKLYLDRLQVALGDFGTNELIGKMSGTVTNFTFSQFADTVRGDFLEKISKQLTGDNDSNKELYNEGWKLCEAFTTRTQLDSWYTWKTRPGKLLIEAVINMDDDAFEKTNETWSAKVDGCKLCDDIHATNLYHCRRCGIVMCKPCGAKSKHVQRKNSPKQPLWIGNEWVCRACKLVITERQAPATA
jgi:hypothetical protein